MKAFWRNDDDLLIGLDGYSVARRSLPLFILLISLMAVAVGCSFVEELTVDTSTSTTLDAPTTTTVEEPAEETQPADTTTTTIESSTTTTVTLAPSPTPDIPTAPTEPPEPTILYAIEEWSEGTEGWAAAGQWKTVGGMLVTDGSSGSFAIAPTDLAGYPDYVVEAEIQIIDPDADTVVMLAARMQNGRGYKAGFNGSRDHLILGYGRQRLASLPFILDNDWHTYRLEVRGNTIRLLFERAEVARIVDNRSLDPGTVAIYCDRGQINVRSFRVLAL